MVSLIPRRSFQGGFLKPGCLIALALAVVALIVVGSLTMKSYNQLVTQQENTSAAWQEIDNQYKRRFDLIPQLVATVKGAAEFERDTLSAVTAARASVGQVQLPAGLPTDPAQLKAYLAAQKGLGSALGRLFAVSERYPELKASQGFLALQDQLEGTENRIAVARRDYIDASKSYNTHLRRFPTNLVAGLFGFEKLAQLDLEAEEREVPQIDFGSGS